MTEKQTPSKRLEEKVDILTENFYEMQGDIKVILQRLEMQPKIDQHQIDGIRQDNVSCKFNANQRFANVEGEVKILRENQGWLVKTVIGQLIVIVIGIVFSIYSFTKGL